MPSPREDRRSGSNRSPRPRATDSLGITLAERTAEVVRERILALQPGFEPGARLYPNQLAADLGVSVTPAREALKLLAAEGLIEISPRRGTRVMSLSIDELDELLRIRGGLETIALRFRTSALTPDELESLAAELQACQRALDDNDLDLCLVHDLEFHRRLVAAGNSSRLLTMWEQTCQQAQVLEVYFPHDRDSAAEALAEHEELLGLLESATPVEVEPALWRHWEVCSRDRVHRAYDRLKDREASDPEPEPRR